MRGKPPGLKRSLDRSRQDYAALVAPFHALIEKLIRRLQVPDGREHIASQILKAMRETHESMRAVLHAAEEFEKETGKLTGRHFDAVLLARPQVEAAIAGMLLLHNPTEYVIRYRRSAWRAAFADGCMNYLQLKGSDTAEAWWQDYIVRLRWLRDELGLTKDHEEAVIAEIEGKPRTPTQKQALLDCDFPTAGKIVAPDAHLLAGSPLAPGADLLWREWRSLCHPNHAGLNGVVRRAFLRGDPVEAPMHPDRATVLAHDNVYQSIVPSLSSMLMLATAVVSTLFREDESLLQECARAWDQVRTGLLLPANLWDGWARGALGILEDLPESPDPEGKNDPSPP